MVGGVGVGKTAMVKAFADYLKYTSLQAALDYTPNLKIHEEREEYCGGKINVHHLHSESLDITLIDTPGITGNCEIDMRALFADGRLEVMPREINAICIMMISHEAKLTESFKYNLGFILNNLPKEAAHNIIFCFGRSLGIEFEPSECCSIKTLQEFVDDHPEIDQQIVQPDRMYLVDNKELKNISSSKARLCWQKTNISIRKMVQDVKTFKPLPVEDIRRIIISKKCLQSSAVTLVDIAKHDVSVENDFERVTRKSKSCSNMFCCSEYSKKMIDGKTFYPALCHKNYFCRVPSFCNFCSKCVLLLSCCCCYFCHWLLFLCCCCCCWFCWYRKICIFDRKFECKKCKSKLCQHEWYKFQLPVRDSNGVRECTVDDLQVDRKYSVALMDECCKLSSFIEKSVIASSGIVDDTKLDRSLENEINLNAKDTGGDRSQNEIIRNKLIEIRSTFTKQLQQRNFDDTTSSEVDELIQRTEDLCCKITGNITAFSDVLQTRLEGE